jgi:ParB-like chromosome segregation protein Spo0J
MAQRLAIKQVPLDQLDPAAYNPRYITRSQFAALKKSLLEFGAVEPAVINKDGTIIGGHMRIEAAKALEWTKFPVVYVDLPDAKAKALNLALNKIEGEWDTALLQELVYELSQQDEIDLELTGFDDAELGKLLKEVAPPEDFDDLDPEGISVDHECPKCGYQWSGSTKPKQKA